MAVPDFLYLARSDKTCMPVVELDTDEEREIRAHATNKRTSAINIQIRVRRAGQPSHSLHPIHGNAVSSSQNSEARLEMFENEKAPTFRGITFPSQSQADAAEVGCQCQLGRSLSGSCVIHRFSRESWQNLRGTHPT